MYSLLHWFFVHLYETCEVYLSVRLGRPISRVSTSPNLDRSSDLFGHSLELLASLLGNSSQFVLGVDIDVWLSHLLLGGFVEDTSLDCDDVLCGVRSMSHWASTGAAEDAVHIVATVAFLCVGLDVPVNLDLVSGSYDDPGEGGSGLSLTGIAVVESGSSLLEVDVSGQGGSTAEAMSFDGHVC